MEDGSSSRIVSNVAGAAVTAIASAPIRSQQQQQLQRQQEQHSSVSVVCSNASTIYISPKSPCSLFTATTGAVSTPAVTTPAVTTDKIRPLLPPSSPLLPPSDLDYAPTSRRFAVLFNLTVVAVVQGYMWMTYATVADPVKRVYGFSNFSINLLSAWSPIMYVPLALVTAPLIDRLGLRGTVTLAGFCVALCGVLRVITVQQPYAEILAHLAEIINGFANPLVMSTPSQLSSLWFPVKERQIATACSSVANVFGSAIAFYLAFGVQTNEQMRQLFMHQAYSGVVLLVWLSCDHFWLDLPLLPPTPSSWLARAGQEQRDAAMRKHGWPELQRQIATTLLLLRNPSFTMLFLIYGVAGGAYAGWIGVLYPILQPLGFTQDDSSWIGIMSILAATAGGLVSSLIATRLKRIKPLIIGLYVFGIASFMVFTVMADPHISHMRVSSAVTSRVPFIVTVATASFLITAANPLFYEASVESSFPVDEVKANAMLTLMFNLTALIFIMITNVLPKDMNWIVCGCWIFCFCLLLLWREEGNRLQIDQNGAFSSSKASLLYSSNNTFTTPANSNTGSHLRQVAASGENKPHNRGPHAAVEERERRAAVEERPRESRQGRQGQEGREGEGEKYVRTTRVSTAATVDNIGRPVTRTGGNVGGPVISMKTQHGATCYGTMDL